MCLKYWAKESANVYCVWTSNKKIVSDENQTKQKQEPGTAFYLRPNKNRNIYLFFITHKKKNGLSLFISPGKNASGLFFPSSSKTCLSTSGGIVPVPGERLSTLPSFIRSVFLITFFFILFFTSHLRSALACFSYYPFGFLYCILFPVYHPPETDLSFGHF